MQEGKEMTEATYTDRRLKNLVVKRKESTALIAEGGECSGAPQEVLDILEVGDPYTLEVKGFNRISGYRVSGVWYARKSDQELEADDQKMIEDSRQKHLDYVNSQRDDWTAREEALPDWAKDIMQTHRDRADERGEDFEIEYMGWGYTLTAVELAVLYSGHEDIVNSSGRLEYASLPNDVIQHLEKYGMSGNQDDWALFVARQRNKEKK